MDVVLWGTSLKQKDVQLLSQRDCTHSSYMNASNLEKPVFFKNLKVFAKLLGLETVEDVLPVDDSPQKNLLKNVHSAVHPQPGPVMMKIGSSPYSCNRGWKIYLDQVKLLQTM